MNPYYLCLLTLIACLLAAFTQHHPGLLVHILISFLAMSVLVIASLQAIILGCQDYLLKHRHAKSLLANLPPLQTMEALLFNIVFSGTLLFSASLISGFVFQPHMMKAFLQPKILLACAAWMVLHLLLLGRRLFGWRGSTAIRWTLGATFLVLLSYFAAVSANITRWGNPKGENRDSPPLVQARITSRAAFHPGSFPANKVSGNSCVTFMHR